MRCDSSTTIKSQPAVIKSSNRSLLNSLMSSRDQPSRDSIGFTESSEQMTWSNERQTFSLGAMRR